MAEEQLYLRSKVIVEPRSAGSVKVPTTVSMRITLPGNAGRRFHARESGSGLIGPSARTASGHD